MKDFRKAQQAFQDGAYFAQQAQDDSIYFRCLFEQAVVYNHQSAYDSVEWMVSRILSQSDRIKDSVLIAGVLKQRGLVRQYQGEYEEAIKIFRELGEIYKRHHITFYHENLMDIGLVYIRLQAWDQAKPYIWESLRYPDLSPRARANALNCYGIVFLQKDILDSAIYYFKASRSAMKDIPNELGVMIADINLGALYMDSFNQNDSALFYLDEASQISEKFEEKKQWLALMGSKAVLLRRMNKPREAQAILEHMIPIADSIKQTLSLQVALYDLALIYNDLKQPQKAFETLLEYADVTDTLYSKEKVSAIEEVNARYETAEKERELANARANLKERQLQNTILGGLVLFVAMIGGILLLRAQNQRKLAIQRVRLEEQRRGTEGIIAATEAERRRIARDLHDGIGQELATLGLALQQGGDANYQSLSTRLDKTTHQLRTLSHQMMPRALETAGLIPAMQELVERSTEGTGIVADFDAFRVPSDLPDDISLALFRVLQELLNNILKHAQAQQIDVLLTYSKDILALTVEDDGVGMPLTQPNHGLGIFNMETRLQTVNGKLSYEQSATGGTRALIKIPYPHV
ncbi:MAG: sensor histidine kinase [Bacteroidota bacterium]